MASGEPAAGSAAFRWVARGRSMPTFPPEAHGARFGGEVESGHLPGGSLALWGLKERRVIRARPESPLWVLPITML